MKKNKEVNILSKILVLGLVLMIALPLVNAGVGLKHDKESALIPEKSSTCMTYSVYNPWNEDSYLTVSLSEELKEVAKSMEAEVVFVPKGTSSSEALPVEFCFKTPKVYEEDCWIGDVFFCKQECTEDMKVYSGEVIAQEAPSEQEIKEGGQGSATQMAVSAPLNIRVQCLQHARNFTPLYVLVALIALILLLINIFKRKKSKNKTSKKKK